MSRHVLAISLLIAAACAPQSPPRDQPAAIEGTSRANLWADSVSRLIELGVHAESRTLVADARSLAERALTVFPDEPLLLHYQGYALFREAGMAWDADESQVPPLLRESERLLARSYELRPLAESAALLARIQGYLSALYPRLAADLGAKSRGYRAQAERLAPNNPRVWLMRGQGSMYTPELHGGGLSNAEQQLVRAIALFGSDAPATPLPAWGEAEAHAWLGLVYAAGGRPADAREAYQRALARVPGYVWVRDSLAALPAR